MGADLYIREIHKDNYHCYEGLSSVRRGYFRDSYNCSNLLWQFGLSYWGMNYKFKEGKLMKKELKRWKRELISAYKKKDWNDLTKRLNHLNKKQKGEWVRYFKSKYLELMIFINLALDNNYGIFFSV